MILKKVRNHLSQVVKSRLYLPLSKLLAWRYFRLVFLTIAASILLITVVFWSLLGAKLQLNNADALVDGFLFKNSSTFHGAVFPGQHTFLLKWPLFYLIKLLGLHAAAFVGLTVVITLITVLSLAYMVYRIERRPLVIGVICLALAAALLLVPPMPYAGGLLPVNMAMLAARNLEYIIFIVSLVLITRAVRIKSWAFGLATLLLAILIASDKFFLGVGLGSAAVMLFVYSLGQKWAIVKVASRWLLAQAVASIGAITILFLINAFKVTHIQNTTGAGPYGLVNNVHTLIIGGAYAFFGLLTNLGANPAVDVTNIYHVFPTFISRLFSISGLPYLMNVLLFTVGCFMAYKLLSRSLKRKTSSKSEMISLMLIWTTVVAVMLFALSNHYFAVDARYLTIVLFAFFVSAATFSRRISWRPEWLVLLGCILTVTIAGGVVNAFRTYHTQQQALADITARNTSIQNILRSHPVSVLVGDYWRVMPIELNSDSSNMTYLPLTNCTQPRQDLTSSAWQLDLHSHSFAYILSYDHSLTGYPNCYLQEIVKAYGRPNASALTAGTTDKPIEQILFYDQGIHQSTPSTGTQSQTPSTIAPLTLDQLPNTNCMAPTVMVVVAHQDDDLFFMNPDLIHDIKSGYCIRSVHVTAGDAGQHSFYWLAREHGSEEAYDTMAGLSPTTVWVQRIAKFANREFATIATPRDNPNISLISLNLPDGGLQGQGFKTYNYESLAKLLGGRINTIQSVDGQSVFSLDQLTDALNNLMAIYSPTEIYTQSTMLGKQYPDHSDHNSVGSLTNLAYAQYERLQFNNLVTIPLKHYIGYPIHGMSANVMGADLVAKEQAFFAYAQFDPAVCNTASTCLKTPTFDAYLTRQYQSSF